MSYWNAKYTNALGEYEITFASKSYEKTKVIEKVCQAVIDDRVQSVEDLNKSVLVQHYIKVPEKPKWISVEDRMPKPFVSVLVYMPEERPLPTVHEGFLAREGMWYANHFDREPMEITHWMPLPEPPEEEV